MKRVDSISSRKRGFTLLELLIVLAILIVVIGMLGTTVWGQYRKALIRAATIQVTSKLHDALELFFQDHQRYPTAAEGLYILADKDNPDPQGSLQRQNDSIQKALQAAGANMMNQQGGMNGMNNMNGNMQGGMGGDMTGMGGMNGNMQGGMGGDMSGMNGMNGNMQGGMGGDMSGMNGMTGDMTGMNGNMNNQNNANMTGNQQVYRRPKITEPYVKENDLKDPWNQPYRYEWPTTKGDGKSPAIWSCGPDKEDNNGEGDDVISWDPEDTSGVMRYQNTSGNASYNSNMNNGGYGGDMNNMNNMNNGGFGGDMNTGGFGGTNANGYGGDMNNMNNMNNINNMNNMNTGGFGGGAGGGFGGAGGGNGGFGGGF